MYYYYYKKLFLFIYFLVAQKRSLCRPVRERRQNLFLNMWDHVKINLTKAESNLSYFSTELGDIFQAAFVLSSSLLLQP